jgi:hypoxanthine-guanine phosphoribosyltransferase
MSGRDSVDSQQRTTKPAAGIKTECEKTAEAVEKTIGRYTEHLMQGALKGAVLADLIRLLQMEEEMDGNQAPQLSIGWASRSEATDEQDE